jgi:general secretion pathway protein G
MQEPQQPLKKKALRRRRRNRGMTLIEIMVVITILGLIAAAVGVAVVPKLEQAKHDRAVLDIQNIQGALKLYYAKKGAYPDTASGLGALVQNQDLETVPQAPWGHDYLYLNEGGKPLLKSYGRDGQEGGQDADADISSAELQAKAGNQ